MVARCTVSAGFTKAIDWFAFCLLPCVLLSGQLLPGQSEIEKEKIDFFESKIRPVLIEHCYECHSEKAQKENNLKGGLILDTRKSIRTGGDSGPAVVPGKEAESLLLSALRHDDYEMPPSGKLSEKIIADFTHWIRSGAVDPRDADLAPRKNEIDFDAANQFWSFQPPQPSAPPPVKDTHWPKTWIDRFVLATMEKEKLIPVNSAEKTALIRRATFDLTGLPPTPQDVSDFVLDRSETAFENVIDRLLDSPRYGERWGRHWLDVARYAEDQAHTFGVSKRVHAFQYRDWVIEAFNKDMPYDRFVKLQIAGDLLLDESANQFERIAGLGFSGLGAIYYKNSDKAKAIADELDDRVDTLTRAFLGLTVSCARCHDHKFDPIPTQDYYSLAGIFASTRLSDRPLVSAPIMESYNQSQAVVRQREKQLKQFRVDHKTRIAEEQRHVIAKYMIATWMTRNQKLANQKVDIPDVNDGLLKKKWHALWEKFLTPKNKALEKIEALRPWLKSKQPDGKSHLEKAPAEVIAIANQFQADIIDLLDQRDEKNKPQSQKAIFTSPVITQKNRSLSIDIDIKGANDLYLVVTDAGNGISNDWASWLDPVITGSQGIIRLNELKYTQGTTDWKSIRINRNVNDEPLKIGETTYQHGIGTHANSVIHYRLPGKHDRFRATGYLDGNGTGSVHFRVYTGPPADLKENLSPKLSKQQTELIKSFFSQSGPFSIADSALPEHLSLPNQQELKTIEHELKSAIESSPPAPPRAHAIDDSKGQDLKVYVRGNPARQGDVAPRRFLRILAGEDRPVYSKGSGREQLAEEIASSSNPLTARVIVNRVWQHHFGTGLVATSSNFGMLGDRPSHPELLDTLSVAFIKSNWSIKWLHREIMRSKTYQASSDHHVENSNSDPTNRFLWRMNRRRLDVESWRDALLKVSGNLDLAMGGPTIRLSDNGNHRRTVYASISRHELDGLLRLFDFPDANVTSSGRSQTTVPQQQLFVLNSEFFIRQAKDFAKRIQDSGENDVTRIQQAYRILYGRQPQPTEINIAIEFLAVEASQQDKLSKWEQYAQALLGANEFLYVD